MEPEIEEMEERCDSCGRGIMPNDGQYRIGAVVRCSDCGELEIRVTDFEGL